MAIATDILQDPARRNVAVLAAAQAMFNCTQTMAIATTPLAAYALLGADKTYATAPIFLTHFGLMLTTLPAALLMGRAGRKAGFTLGALIGVIGAAVSFFAIWRASFPLICVGGFLQGVAGAFAWHYRFAATDIAAPSFRAKAISLVMAGGVIAGLVGPQIAKWAVSLFDPVLFAGVYLMSGVFALAISIIVQFVEIPVPAATKSDDSGRPMREIARQPAFITAVACSMIGYGVMTLVMSATPLAMLGCGFKFEDSATVIQAHVIAMFGPSFFTGHLIQKFGLKRILIAGIAAEIGCALINLSGIAFGNFLLANILVGLGWNFCFVGGSALLTSVHTPQERAKVQGTHDFLVYAATATSAALSGVLQANAGWALINAAAIPMLAVLLGVIVWGHGIATSPATPKAVAEKA